MDEFFKIWAYALPAINLIHAMIAWHNRRLFHAGTYFGLTVAIVPLSGRVLGFW